MLEFGIRCCLNVINYLEILIPGISSLLKKDLIMLNDWKSFVTSFIMIMVYLIVSLNLFYILWLTKDHFNGYMIVRVMDIFWIFIMGFSFIWLIGANWRPLVFTAENFCIYDVKSQKVLKIIEQMQWFFWEKKRSSNSNEQIVYLPEDGEINTTVSLDTGEYFCLSFGIRYRDFNEKTVERLIGFFGTNIANPTLPKRTRLRIKAWLEHNRPNPENGNFTAQMSDDLKEYFEETPLRLTHAGFYHKPEYVFDWHILSVGLVIIGSSILDRVSSFFQDIYQECDLYYYTNPEISPMVNNLWHL